MTGGRLIAIGEIVKPHGLRGEVKIHSLTDRPERFRGLTACTLLDPLTQGQEERRIEGCRLLGATPVLKLERCETVADAGALVGRLLTVPEAAVLPLPAGHFYPWQLEGSRVLTEDGATIGEFVGVETGALQDLWVVRDGEREHLVPAVAEIIIKVDLDARTIVIRPPDGLLEL